jgi:hypothetical protein
MNLVQVQEHLKGMPTPVLMGYANGQNPQVPPYIALGELNRRKQMEQQPAQPPQGSVKDQIEQSLMQPQQLPGLAAQGVPVPQPPQPQGIPAQMPRQMAGAAPQQPPTRMAAGGLASVPMRRDMFNYAPGGIVAFANEENEQVVKDKEDDEPKGIKYDTERRLPTRARPDQKAAGDDLIEGLTNAIKSSSSGVGDFLSRLVNPNAELAANRGLQTAAQLERSSVPQVEPVVKQPGGVADLVPASNKVVSGLTEDQAVAKAKQRNQQDSIAFTKEDEAVLRRRFNGAEGDAAKPPAAATTKPAAPRPAAPANDPNDPLAFLRGQMNQAEPTYKTRAKYMEEAAKTNPELLVKPEDGLRGLLEKLSTSQVDARERAMRGERGQQMSDISNALIAAGEATRGQKGSGIGSAFGGFGKNFNASSAAATERQAARDALQQKQDLDMAKLQYETSEKARARAMGDVTAEMNHDKNIAELQNKLRDDKRQAANYLAVDARTRDANASAAALRREQIQAIREGKPSPEQKLLTDVMARVNGDDRIAAISAGIKSGSLVPGTPDFNKAVRATEALIAPYYEQAGLKPPKAAQLAEDAADPEKKGFWASLFGSSSKPAPQPNVVDFSKLPK